MKRKIKIILPILLGVFFLYLTFEITSVDQRSLIINYIKSAQIEFVLLAMCFGASADIIRGLRWRILAQAIGYKSNMINSIASVFMCYTSNILIPRSGEIIRATVLSEYDKIPLGKTFGTIAAERLIDILISFFILILVWTFQYEVILESFFDDDLLYKINNNIMLIVFIVILMIVTLIFITLKVKRIKKFFKGIIEGILSLTKLEDKLFQFAIFSSLIWAFYILAFFIIKFSIPQLSVIDNSLIFSAFVVGVYSISLSNHGFGVYPLAISLFLMKFGVDAEIGLAYGWLAWSCQAIITIILGGLSFFVLPLLKTSD